MNRPFIEQIMKQTENENNQNSGASVPKFFRQLFGAQPAASEPVVEVSEPSAVIPASPDGQPAPRVLVVDDDPVILKTVGMKLTKAGFHVLTNTDGAEAIGTVRKEHPDAIVLDICLPADVNVNWDGFTVMEWLRRLEQEDAPPVIIITGTGSEKNRQRALDSGAVAFFEKPINNEELVKVIQKSLADRKIARAKNQTEPISLR